MKNHHTPHSERLFSVLRDEMRDLIPDDARYQDSFDTFEYLWGLCYLGLAERAWAWAPFGAYVWRYGTWTDEPHPIKVAVDRLIEAQGEDFGLLQAGLFDRSVDKLREVKTALDRFIDEVRAKLR